MTVGDGSALWRIARTLEQNGGGRNRRRDDFRRGPGRKSLPPLLFFTDPLRTPNAEAVVARLPRGAGVVFRHFGAADAHRQGERLRRIARARGVVFLVGADIALALALDADGIHLPERRAGRAGEIARLRRRFLVTAAAHGLAAAGRARRAGVDALVVSPVFASRSPSAGRPMGALAFAALARRVGAPVYALGGVNERTARSLRLAGAAGLAAVESLSPGRAPPPAKAVVDDRSRVRAVISDVDGTLLTSAKALTAAAIAAVARLRREGLAFSIVSSRPPRGLAGVIAALDIDAPVAGFNGAVIADPDLTVLKQRLIDPRTAREAARALASRGVDVWVFHGQDWFLRDPLADHVRREVLTVGFEPVVVSDLTQVLDGAAKIVGVSADAERLATCEMALQAELGGRAAVARSQLYYLDITHPMANKGQAVREIARRLAIAPARVAVIGDGANDVAMFAVAGFSIAMGNAEPAVQAAADAVTSGHDEDGFARAVDGLVLARTTGRGEIEGQTGGRRPKPRPHL